MNDSAIETILKLVATGRGSLDHFVDTLQIDCSEAKGTADSLVKKGLLKLKGRWSTDLITYELTEHGKNVASDYLQAESDIARANGMLDIELEALRSIGEPWTLRRGIEERLTSIPDGGVHSILVRLYERGLITMSGMFVVKVSLTSSGRALRDQTV